jgi:WhiB family transcriptional regulator, redox-sensing transcriptional regulator
MAVAAEAGLAAPVAWVFSGACRDADPDLFFPIGSSGPGLRQIAEAKAICARCPVITDCLSYALATGQDAGVWGGTTEQERRHSAHAGVRKQANSAVERSPSPASAITSSA